MYRVNKNKVHIVRSNEWQYIVFAVKKNKQGCKVGCHGESGQ